MSGFAHLQDKKYCRVCSKKVNRFYKNNGGRRCAVCLHRTHRDHLSVNGRVCRVCAGEEMKPPAKGRQSLESINLVHLTDLHFGEKGSGVRLEVIKKWLGQHNYDYILISGDLTARSRTVEYQAAACWLDDIEALGIKVGVVPGNHDIGYWGNIKSLASIPVGRKYHRWIKWINRPIEPYLKSKNCAILGLNSAHGLSPFKLFNGYLSRNQRSRAVEIFKIVPDDCLKVVFCHHPLVRFEGNQHRAMFNAEKARNELINAGVKLFLWGHQHSFESIQMVGAGGSCFALQSPTISGRIRCNELPGFTSVHWLLNNKVIFKLFEVDSENIREKKAVEYTLKEEPASPVLK